jgi:hypothetical protein
MFPWVERSEPVADAIGRALLAFSDLEARLASANSFLLFRGPSGGDEGRILGWFIGYSQKVSLFDKLVRYRLKDRTPSERLNELVRSLRSAGSMRNRLIHTEWMETGRPDIVESIRLITETDPYREEWLKLVTGGDIAPTRQIFVSAGQAITRFLVDFDRPLRGLPAEA